MRRLTRRDWEVINEALAYYEAATDDFNLTDAEQEALEEDIATVRGKVYERGFC